MLIPLDNQIEDSHDIKDGNIPIDMLFKQNDVWLAPMSGPEI